jgi:hypothetical protein
MQFRSQKRNERERVAGLTRDHTLTGFPRGHCLPLRAEGFEYPEPGTNIQVTSTLPMSPHFTAVGNTVQCPYILERVRSR